MVGSGRPHFQKESHIARKEIGSAMGATLYHQYRTEISKAKNRKQSEFATGFRKLLLLVANREQAEIRWVARKIKKITYWLYMPKPMGDRHVGY